MKSGASDPFAEEEAESERETEVSSDEAATGDTTESAVPASRSTETADMTVDSTSDADDGGLSRDELPLILRRDKVKDERPEVHQLFVQTDTHERAVDAERELEERLGVDLARTDAREAIYLAGMANLDEAAATLREWGYDL